MSSQPNEIDPAGIVMTGLDLDKKLTLTTSTGSGMGLKLDYDLLTTPKSFTINPSGASWTNGTTTYTTGLDRIGAIQQAFQAVVLPTEVDSLEISNTLKVDAISNVANIKMDYNTNTTNNIILNDTYALNSTLPYPLTGAPSTFQTIIKKDATDKVSIQAPDEINFAKCSNPTFNSADLTVTTTPLGTLSPAMDYSINNLTCSSVFSGNNKFIYAITSYTTKIFYLQEFSSNNFLTIDLTSLTTGSANYSARIATLGIAQFIPVYYNSATDVKFYIRLQENSPATNLYFITCVGDPTLLTSYTWGTNYALSTASVPSGLVNNGDTYTPVPFTNGSTINSQRISVIYHDTVNDLFVLASTSSAVTGLYYNITNPNITTVCSYPSPVPSGFTSTASYMVNSVENTGTIGRIFNNNNNTTSTMYVGYWDNTSFRLSQPVDLTTSLVGGFFNNSSNADMFFIDVSPTQIAIFIPWFVNIASPLSQTLNLALYTWDKNINNAPVFVRSALIATLTGAQTMNTIGYPSVRAYNINVVEVISPLTDTYYISRDSLITGITKSNIGIKSTFLVFTNGEGECNALAKTNITKPMHYYVRGSALTTMTDIAIATVSNTGLSVVTNYLNFSYNVPTTSATIGAPLGDLVLNPLGSINASGKTLDMTNGQIHKCPLIHGPVNQDFVIEAQGTGDLVFETNNVNRLIIADSGVSTFTTLPESPIVPSNGNQLCNKNYVDGVASGGTPPTPSSFTPVLSFDGGGTTIVYTTQTGEYILIGKLCVFQATITTSTITGGTGGLTASLPFSTTSIGGGGLTVGFISGLTTGGTTYAVQLQQSSAIGRVVEKTTAATLSYTPIIKARIGNTFTIQYGGAYIRA